jgi:hypothetical protein
VRYAHADFAVDRTAARGGSSAARGERVRPARGFAVLPNDPERLAERRQRGPIARRDTYFDGDGSGGRRSRGLKMEELYARLGYEGWFRPGRSAKLMAAMRARMGEAGALQPGGIQRCQIRL